MHWILYIIGFIALMNNDAASSQLGIFLIACGLFVQFRKKKDTAPVHSKKTGDVGSFGGGIHGEDRDSDGNPIKVSVDIDGYGQTPSGDKVMKDSDGNWVDYHV